MKTPVPSGLLDKYLNGNCTPQELEEVENWYQSFENLPEINTSFPESESEDYSKSVFEIIKSKIKLKESKNKSIWKFPINKQACWYLAASVLIGIGVSLLFEKNHLPVKSKTTLALHAANFFDKKNNFKDPGTGFNHKTFSALILPI